MCGRSSGACIARTLEARIVVTGCYAQRAPEEIAQLPGVAMVVGNSHKTQIAELMSTPYHGQIHVGDIFAAHEFLSAPVEDASGDRSRPNLKIQDGCRNRCSFCIIPYVRGRSRSAPVQQVVDQVRSLSERYPEVVLTGINLGRWGREPGFAMRLVDLLRASAERDGCAAAAVELGGADGLVGRSAGVGCRFAADREAHPRSAAVGIGYGAAADASRYRPKHYESRVRQARELMPDAAIGADVMVGFPGRDGGGVRGDPPASSSGLPFTYLAHLSRTRSGRGRRRPTVDQVPESRAEVAGASVEATRPGAECGVSAPVCRADAERGHDRGRRAVTSNYLTVEMSRPRPSREMVDLQIGAITEAGLKESAPFLVLAL